MISSEINECVKKLNEIMHVEENFDIVYREISIMGKKAVFYFVDGFCKSADLRSMIEVFMEINNPKLISSAEEFSKTAVTYGQVTLSDDENEIVTAVLAGQTVLVVDGFEKAVLISARSHPQRATSEPDKDKVFRGSRDGFVESIVLNTALIRRRIRDPRLIIKHMQVGSQSKTDVALCYMKGKVDKKLLDNILNRLDTTKVQSLTMNQESIVEILTPKRWKNPLPKFKYTERPDTTAAHVFEGDIAIIVDNSPAVLIVPATIFSVMEEANDYYFPPVIGTYLKLTRSIIMLITAVITPVWLLLTQNPDWVPEWLSFILVTDNIQVPLLAQLIILEIAIDGLNLASLNTPNTLISSLSILAAIIVGDYAVGSGWFSSQALLYTAFVALANFAQPGYELGYAFKFIRIFLLLATGFFNVWGFVIGLIIVLAVVLNTKMLSGRCYLYPLIPFNWKKLKYHLYRASLTEKQESKKDEIAKTDDI